MGNASQALEILPALYDAAAGQRSWQSLAGVVTRAFGADSFALQIQNHRSAMAELVSVTENYTPQIIANYVRNRIYLQDEWVQGHLRHKTPGIVIGSDDLISDEAFARSRHFDEHCRHLGVFYVVGAVVPLGIDDNLVVIGAHRARRHGLFKPKHKTLMQPLVPHFRQALQLRARLNGLELQAQSSFKALEALSLGVVVVDSSARLVFANKPADSILRSGLGISVREGRVCALDHAKNAGLQKRTQEASSGGIGRSYAPGGTLVVSRAGNGPLLLSIYPFPSPLLAGTATEPLALIFLSDPKAIRKPSAEIFAQIYGLTPAEIRLAEALTDGQRLQDYAERCNISIHTVKTQLKHVFQKTGCERQSDLIREFLSNPFLRLDSGGINEASEHLIPSRRRRG